jgi:hypothetical protein
MFDETSSHPCCVKPSPYIPSPHLLQPHVVVSPVWVDAAHAQHSPQARCPHPAAHAACRGRHHVGVLLRCLHRHRRGKQVQQQQQALQPMSYSIRVHELATAAIAARPCCGPGSWLNTAVQAEQLFNCAICGCEAVHAGVRRCFL